MNPFELFQSSEVYKIAVLYFSKWRGLAIVARNVSGENVEVIQLSGEVDPHSGNFTALDYTCLSKTEGFPVMSRKDFENLVGFLAARIDEQTRMSIIEPDILKAAMSKSPQAEPGQFLH
ncbi:MAG: hypothetical protein AB1646_14515 [Thermodesulfobacteriota bacterium]